MTPRCLLAAALLLLAALAALFVSAGPLPASPAPPESSLAPLNDSQLLDGDLNNSTRQRAVLHSLDGPPVRLGSAPICRLPTCFTSNLGSSLQGGDETAGDRTRDYDGIGRK